MMGTALLASRRGGHFAIDWPAGVLLAVALVSTNVLGAVVVTALAVWVLPMGPPPPVDVDRITLVNTLAVAGYLLVAVPLVVVWSGLRLRMGSEDPAQERRLVLLGPLRLVSVQAVFWLVATVLVGALNARFSWRLGLSVSQFVLLGGVYACSVSYLLAERILRRAATRVLVGDPAPRGQVGVLVRWVLFWLLGTAAPVAGLVVIAVEALVFSDVTVNQLAAVMVVGGLGVMVVGLLITIGAARAVADPVASVRRAMRQVADGEFEVSVPVYDGTELGQLQVGFNTMAAGLRERERIRELFARQVGRDVALASAAVSEVRLGGEVRVVAVLFVDLVGFMSLAALRPPTEVVALLNRFFDVVVEVVEDAGGWINKFEGDAALAVFGAPSHHHDPAGSALSAGRVLAARLADTLPDLATGIGASAGEVVAGYVGNEHRFEYTVIGDPVNEAARLSELAKSVPGGLLAAGRAVEMAGPGEARLWCQGEVVTLRGRGQTTRLATPAPPAPAS
jgi:adenylate cyclase